MLFIATLSNAAFANQDDDKNKDIDGTQGTLKEPDCEYTSASECL
jgi:hypothetical protein